MIPGPLHADVYRWDNGAPIPGTEGVTLKPKEDAPFSPSNISLVDWNQTGHELEFADFSGANLITAQFDRSKLTMANFTDAYLLYAKFTGADLAGAKLDHIRYRSLDDPRFGSAYIDFTGANLTGANLTDSEFAYANFTSANLTGANLIGAQLDNASLTNADFTGAVVRRADSAGVVGFTKEQLYATQSYQDKNLRGIQFNQSSMKLWNLAGQDLAYMQLWNSQSDLTSADLSGANLANADFRNSLLNRTNLKGVNLKNAWLGDNCSRALFDATTVYNQWTVGCTSELSNLATLEVSPIGDLDADDELSAADIDTLVSRMHYYSGAPPWWQYLPQAAFDFNGDQAIDLEDHRVWVQDLKHTWFGDADLNGEFSSADFVQVLQAGKYELPEYAGWAEGDWNGDGVFDSADFITAFVDGGYERGPRVAVAAVPEPTGCSLLLVGLLCSLFRRRTLWAVSP